jgi:hypothetical protein
MLANFQAQIQFLEVEERRILETGFLWEKVLLHA